MIYADVNASLPPLVEVKDYLNKRLYHGPFGNPNARHSIGRNLKEGIEKCRAICAANLGSEPNHVIFNSGASEGITCIFHSILNQNNTQKRNHILLSRIEHKAVLNIARFYERKGYKIDYIENDTKGMVKIKSLIDKLKKLKNKIAIVSVMAANNETGLIQPIGKINSLCCKEKIPFFSDTTQIFGKQEFNFNKSNLEYAVMSGHKIGALPGTGILLIKNPKNFTPLIPGAFQEYGHRGGTQNYLGIETLAVALQTHKNIKEKAKNSLSEKTKFEEKLKKTLSGIFIAGENAPRLPNTTTLSYPGIHGQALQIELESKDIFVTTSSACTDNEPIPSHVFKAMGLEDNISRGMIRISTDLIKPKKDYKKILEALIKTYKKLNRIKSF